MKIISRLRNQIKSSLRSRTLVLFVGLLLFFTVVFISAMMIIQHNAEHDYRQSTAETAVDNVESTLYSTIDNYNYISRLIMVNQRVVSFLHAPQATMSISYEARMGMYETLNMYSDISYIEAVYIFRNDGQSAHTGKKEYNIDYNSPEWQVIASKVGGRVIAIDCNGLISKYGSAPTLTLSRAIYDLYSQERIGTLVMVISDTVFKKLLELQQPSKLCIVDESGKLLCGSEELASRFTAECITDSISFSEIKFEGANTTLATKKTELPFVIMCSTGGGKSVPYENAFALFFTLLAFLISVFVSIWFISANVTKPVLTLNDAMEKTKSSGWLEHIDADMPDNEIGRLAESYNSMIDYLNELFNKLLAEEQSMRKAELRVLQEQIKPHFLYNTLETISYMAVRENAVQAHEALERLGSFYRNFLSKGNKEITLRRELRIAEDYLALQKLRYGEAFTDEYDIAPETLDINVPKLLLQPLVENSIYHGARPKGELCTIRISSRLSEEGLHISVYDNGVGMSEECIEAAINRKAKDISGTDTHSTGSGFGLSGTIERLRYFTNREDVVTIRSEVGEYTEIEIFIPSAYNTRSE